MLISNWQEKNSSSSLDMQSRICILMLYNHKLKVLINHYYRHKFVQYKITSTSIKDNHSLSRPYIQHNKIHNYHFLQVSVKQNKWNDIMMRPCRVKLSFHQSLAYSTPFILFLLPTTDWMNRGTMMIKN
jgi:hypothetical protein